MIITYADAHGSFHVSDPMRHYHTPPRACAHAYTHTCIKLKPLHVLCIY